MQRLGGEAGKIFVVCEEGRGWPSRVSAEGRRSGDVDSHRQGFIRLCIGRIGLRDEPARRLLSYPVQSGRGEAVLMLMIYGRFAGFQGESAMSCA